MIFRICVFVDYNILKWSKWIAAANNSLGAGIPTARVEAFDKLAFVIINIPYNE